MNPGFKELLQHSKTLKEAQLLLREAEGLFAVGKFPEKSLKRLKRIYSQLPFTKETQ